MRPRNFIGNGQAQTVAVYRGAGHAVKALQHVRAFGWRDAGAPEFDINCAKLLIYIGRVSRLPLQQAQLGVV